MILIFSQIFLFICCNIIEYNNISYFYKPDFIQHVLSTLK